MKGKYVIGVDCGTQSTKALVVDKNGKVIAEASEKVKVSSPFKGWAEQSGHWWWTALIKVLNKVTAKINKDDLAGIGLSHQRESFVMLDRNFSELRPAILWMDLRSKNEIKEIEEDFGKDKFNKITGKLLDSIVSTPKILWVKNNEKEIFRKVYKLMDAGSYLNYKLTGNATGSLSSVDTLGLCDIAKKEYSKEILSFLGIDGSILPGFVNPGEPAGCVTADAASATGLPEGLPVIACGGDGQVCALGLSATALDDITLMLGTSVAWGMHSTDYLNSRYFRTFVGTIPGTYYNDAVLISGCNTITWFAGSFSGISDGKTACCNKLEIASSNKKLEQTLDEEAEKINIGSDGLITIPHWRGVTVPYGDPGSKGLTIGWSDYHKSAHFYRSILEGISYEVKTGIEGLKDVFKIMPKKIKIGGGGANSRLLTQIICDMNNIKGEISESVETTALGAAMITAYATGFYNSINEAFS